jgi:hypothetical protein
VHASQVKVLAFPAAFEDVQQAVHLGSGSDLLTQLPGQRSFRVLPGLDTAARQHPVRISPGPDPPNDQQVVARRDQQSANAFCHGSQLDGAGSSANAAA